MPSPPAVTVPETVRCKVEALIAELAAIDKPDVGLSATLSGNSFPPAGQSDYSCLLLADHGIEHHSAVLQLVEIGPFALPALLEHLTDATPTKLVIRHEGGFGSMWYGRELSVNQTISRESGGVVKAGLLSGDNSLSAFSDRERLSTYTVTVGDVCFMVIGMIGNRHYEAVRYQPTLCIVVNSPVQEPRLAQAVRGIWASPFPRQRLFESLQADYHTPGTSDRLQCGAAARLLYYFPTETAAEFAQRIDAFQAASLQHASADTRRVRDEADYLEALSYTTNPVVHAALLRVIEKTDEPAILNACINPTVVRMAGDTAYRAMERILKTPPAGAQSAGLYGDRYRLLSKSCAFYPQRAQALFNVYAALPPLICKRACILALGNAPDVLPWAPHWLASHLEDRTDTGLEYGPEYDRFPLRVCDEAAEALVRHLPGARFRLEGTHEDLDAQIARIRRILQGEAATVVYAPLPRDGAPTVVTLDPVKVIEMKTGVSTIYPISDGQTIWAGYGGGYFKGTGYVYETWQIATGSGEVVQRMRLDTWIGGVNFLDPMDKSVFCCHYADGALIERDIRTGAEQRRIRTPFQDSGDGADRFQSEMVVTAGNRWIFTFTEDGVLHSLDTVSGKHTTEWKLATDTKDAAFAGRGKLISVRGRNQILLSFSEFDRNSLRVWNQDTRKMTELKRVPFDGWRNAWGNVAWNRTSGVTSIWDLEKRQRIRMPASVEKAQKIVCDDGGTVLFALAKDGSVEGFDLKSQWQTCRLRTPSAKGRKDLALSFDGRWLFWFTFQSWSELPRLDQYVIAVFAVGAAQRNL